MSSSVIYLDHNATTPCDPRVVEAMLPYFTDNFGNASSRNHSLGWTAEKAVESARQTLAEIIGAKSEKEIIFTSGSTEGNNLGIKGVFEMYASKGNHIITTNIEHKAVLDACHSIEGKGAEVTYLPVQPDGLVNLSDLEAAIKPTTILICIMFANNEIGTIMPMEQIGTIAKKHNVLFMTDATQAVGKMPIDVNALGIDILTFTAHKMYGPKGVGAIYVRRKNPRVKVTSQIDGGGHERGMRSGTLNVPGIIGFAKAAELCMNEMEADAKRLGRWRDKLETELLKIDEAYLNGHKEHRLPHVTNISFKYVEGEGLLMGINEFIALSSGSACTSASLEPSYVLRALGLGDDLAHSSLRFGLGRFNTEDQIDFTIKKVTEVVERLRDLSPLWEMFKEGVDMNAIEWDHH